MGLKSGDKSRYYRQRRKRNTQRALIRELRKTLQNKAGETSKTTSAAS